MLSSCQAVPLQHHQNAIIEGNKIMLNYEEEIKEITWENSRHFTFPPLTSPQNKLWETCMSTRAPSMVIRYMYDYPNLGIVLLICCATWKIWINQPEAQPRSEYKWNVISIKFLRLFLWLHFSGKPVVSSCKRCQLFSQAKKRKEKRV